MSQPKTVGELIKYLETLPENMMVRAGRYDAWRGTWGLEPLGTDKLFTDPEGTCDLTDKERDADIEPLILY
jgi:hypothetical protein